MKKNNFMLKKIIKKLYINKNNNDEKNDELQ